MQKIDQKAYLRVLDANFNRAKEGLRVCEDSCRFVLNSPVATRKYKNLRHQLTKSVSSLGLKKIIEGRNIAGDVGRSSTKTELKRRGISDIFYANSQRVKESVRVLEEFAKIKNPKLAQQLKKIRYMIYALEKSIIKKC